MRKQRSNLKAKIAPTFDVTSNITQNGAISYLTNDDCLVQKILIYQIDRFGTSVELKIKYPKMNKIIELMKHLQE